MLFSNANASDDFAIGKKQTNAMNRPPNAKKIVTSKHICFIICLILVSLKADSNIKAKKN